MAAFESVYARAFAEAAGHDPAFADAAMAQLYAFADAYGESRDLREVLENPSVTEKQKLGVIDAICGRIGSDPKVRNFIAVLVRHDRIASIKDILAETRDELDRRNGAIEAEVITARPLDDSTRDTFRQGLARLAGNDNVRATYREDPALLGGAMVRMGSTVYDGSVRGKLDRLREQLAAG